MNDQDFQYEMETLLGGNLVDVELTEDDYDLAFQRAKRMMQQRGNNNLRRDFITIPIVAETVTYQLPTNTDEIMQIIKPNGYSTNDPFTEAAIQEIFGVTGGLTSQTLATYELSSQMLENLSIYAVDAVPYHFDRIGKSIRFLKTPKVDQNWIADCYVHLADDEYRDIFWIQEWTLAELKIMLGRAYSKFASLSAPTGETSLQGDILVNEGREDKLNLIEDIKNHIDAAPTSLPILLG